MLYKSDHYHFIGIGGIGMSGIALYLLEKNCPVSGSDLTASAITEQLQKKGAQIFIGHSGDYISPGMTVVFNTDIKEDNPEYQAAGKSQCRLLHRSEMLMEIMKESRSLAVAGTHGKTTTSALLATVLSEGGLNPSFCIGGILPRFEANAKYGKGNYFAVEADESDGSFLRYHPHGAIVTNMDFDHMDYFKTESTLLSAFQQFVSQVENQDLLFLCGDDPQLKRLRSKGALYGFSDHCNLKCTHYRPAGWHSFFDLDYEGKLYQDIELGLIGVHNVLNSSAVFGMALRLGINENHIRNALKSFGGVKRRCEKKENLGSLLFLDDYAHHPTEIQATLKAIRAAVKGRRLIVIYQPHRYSRTRDCLGSHGTIFNESDLFYLTEIYPAGEQPIAGISSEEILKEIQASAPMPCALVPRKSIGQEVMKNLTPHDVVVTMGAGDITNLGPEIAALLKNEKITF